MSFIGRICSKGVKACSSLFKKDTGVKVSKEMGDAIYSAKTVPCGVFPGSRKVSDVPEEIFSDVRKMIESKSSNGVTTLPPMRRYQELPTDVVELSTKTGSTTKDVANGDLFNSLLKDKLVNPRKIKVNLNDILK